MYNICVRYLISYFSMFTCKKARVSRLYRQESMETRSVSQRLGWPYSNMIHEKWESVHATGTAEWIVMRVLRITSWINSDSRLISATSDIAKQLSEAERELFSSFDLADQTTWNYVQMWTVQKIFERVAESSVALRQILDEKKSGYWHISK